MEIKEKSAKKEFNYKRLINKDRLINIKETIRYLGYGNAIPDEDMLALIEDCSQKIKEASLPLFKYIVSDIKENEQGLLLCDKNLMLPGKSIKKHLKDCKKAVLCCATLSKEVDEIIDMAQKEDMLYALILDACANTAIEELRIYAEEVIAVEYSKYDIVWQFGIGYGDLPLYLQTDFLRLVGAKDIGISANKRYILEPLKSVSGFLGLKEKNSKDNKENKEVCTIKGCDLCSNKESCIYKKLPV